jgi:plastocyanin
MRFTSLIAFAAFPPLVAIACSSTSSGNATGSDASADVSASSSGSSGTSGSSSSGSSGTSGTSGTSGSSGSSGTSGSTSSGGTDAGGDGAVQCTGDTTLAYAKCVEADAGTAGNQIQDYGSTTATITSQNGDYAQGIPASYDIPCVRVKVGATVTWTGNFTTHPLRPAECNPTTGDKIAAFNGPGLTTSMVMTTPGIYGFQCLVHSSGGMKGVVIVTP